MTLPDSKEPSLGTSWFQKSGAPPPPSEPAPASAPPPLELEGDPKWAVVIGALSGAAGGAAMMFVATEVARRLRFDADIIGTIGRAARVLGDNSFGVGVGVAVAIGCVVGILFGALMRHTRRLIARLLAGMLLAVVLWTLVHAFVLKSFAAASLGALPFGPMIAGAAVFGICVAILRPPSRRARS